MSATTSTCSFQPDILGGFHLRKTTRIFTFHLREGHKWSDGHPFTADDFRYWWEDVILNKKLTPGGGALELRPHGELPRFEVLDDFDGPLHLGYSPIRISCRRSQGRSRS